MPSNRLDLWERNRNHISSSKGGWRIGEAVYNHGYSMMRDLVGEVSYFQLMLLNITGSLPDPRLAQWFEGCFICLSWPDSRIWCNQIGALAGSTRCSPLAASTAGSLASDSLMYGPGVIPSCMSFIRKAHQKHQKGITVSQLLRAPLARQRSIPGYGRPIAKGDERVIRMQQVSTALGLTPGPHEQLALEISTYLTEQQGECINFGGYMVAVCADHGLSAEQMRLMCSLMVSSGVQACYDEAVNKPAGSFLPMRCEDIRYTGKPPRQLPE